MFRAIEEAENIECDMDDFRIGLAAMWHELNQRLQAEGVDPTDEDVLNELADETD
jgi:hypothetical protein